MRSAVRTVLLGQRPAYQGFVATRSFLSANVTTASFTQAQIKTYHYARDNITSLRLLFTNWYTVNETDLGTDTTISAAIEYNGTRYRVQFSASNNGTIPHGNILLSDAVNVTIPAGVKFYIHQWWRNASGLMYSNPIGGNSEPDATGGDLAYIAASGQTDIVMTGDPSSGTLTTVALPTPGVIASTKRPSFLLIGDSRSMGAQGRAGGNSARGDTGEFQQIGANYAYFNAGQSGETALNLTTNYAKRALLAPYASHVLFNPGINDIRSGTVAATLEGYLQTAWAKFAGSGRKIFQSTVTVDTSASHGTDSIRIALNGWIRGLPTGASGIIEIADVTETARNSGAWNASYTTDSLHENQTGYDAIEAANLMSAFRR